MSKLFKKVLASALSLTLVVGLAGFVGAAAKGTDVVTGTKWESFSIHGNNAADKGKWENELIKAGQKWCINANEASGVDAYKTYGESAKITKSDASSFLMDVESTGWSAIYNPMNGKVMGENPWGVTATKVVNVERGKVYNISFKIKGLLENEITVCDDTTVRKDGTHYTKGTGKFNYVKHFHIKAYDDTDPDGAALSMQSITATQGGKNVLTVGRNDKGAVEWNNLIAMDSKNTADDGYVTVNAVVTIPNDKADYQKKKSVPSLGVKFAFGPYLKNFVDENNMHGTIEVKDFKVVTGDAAKGAGKAKVSSIKAKKKSLVVKAKASGASKVKVQVALKKSFKSAKSKTIKSGKTATFKGLKAKKKYYVRARGYKLYGTTKIWGAYSKVKSKKTKK